MSRTDKDCLRLCMNGQPQMFRDLVVRHQGPLMGYLTGWMGDEEAAEEAAQETFVRAFFALGKLEKPELFFSWLLGIARRAALETGRDKWKRTQLARGDGPDLAVRQAVGELPESYRQVILLRYYVGLSCRDVAKELGMPAGTVTKRLSRAYALLRESLQRISQREDLEVQP
jgi:DNA-directed RNA polymerase specialized sigma24 family protein